jgi:tRNA (guanine-N7-)-methyltransferase
MARIEDAVVEKTESPSLLPSHLDRNSPFFLVRTALDRTQRVQAQFEANWHNRPGIGISAARLKEYPKAWLEVGAGSGDFFMGMARLNPDTLLIAIERDKMRGRALVRRGKRAALPNLLALRGNVVPALVAEVPDGSLERIFILYPCPWPKNAQRKNRWYNHPVMAHMIRALRPGGTLIWASDQKFYIDEAHFASETFLGLETLAHGEISAHPENGMEHFPLGRTKFEATFLAAGQPCYQLISRKK